jgi:tRNA(fMet)-specific endonuclease VapC
MLQYMLDTNICIHVMKGYPQTVLGRFNRLAEQLCVSSITVAELCYGAEKSARRNQAVEAIEQFIANLDVVPFSTKAAKHHGQLRAELERVGATAGAFDMLIAAHARSEGLIVVTRNTREFERMPGLRVENWV